MQEVLMTPDMCMRFLVWSYYYHEVIPQKNHSYRIKRRHTHYFVQSYMTLNSRRHMMQKLI